MGGLMVDPLRLSQIRECAKKIRQIIGVNQDGYIDIVRIYEYIFPKIGIDFEVLTKTEMGTKHGETLIGKNIIHIREDIYEGACNGNGRDRLTMAHELGHLLLHRLDNISLARNENCKIPPYCNPEWQANAFAGELLAPHRFLKDKEIYDITSEYGVSVSAAKMQKKR